MHKTKGDDSPDKFPNVENFSFYVKSFQELSTTRVNGGQSAISFTAIVEFARIFNVEDPDFFDIMRIMDNTYLEEVSKKENSKTEGS